MNRTFVIYFYLFLDFRIGDFTLIRFNSLRDIFACSLSDVSLILGHPVYMTGTFVGLPAAAATFFLLLPGLEFRAFKLVHDILEQISRPIFKVVYFFSSFNNSFRFKESLKRFFEGNYKWVGKNIFTYLGIATNISISSSFLIEKSLRRFFQL